MSCSASGWCRRPSISPPRTRPQHAVTGARRSSSGSAGSSAVSRNATSSRLDPVVPPTRRPSTPAPRCGPARPRCATARWLFDRVRYGDYAATAADDARLRALVDAAVSTQRHPASIGSTRGGVASKQEPAMTVTVTSSPAGPDARRARSAAALADHHRRGHAGRGHRPGPGLVAGTTRISRSAGGRPVRCRRGRAAARGPGRRGDRGAHELGGARCRHRRQHGAGDRARAGFCQHRGRPRRYRPRPGARCARGRRHDVSARGHVRTRPDRGACARL